VLVPRAVLGERFYRSRSWPLGEGDGKNLAGTTESPPWSQCQGWTSLPCRRPPSVRDAEGKQQNPPSIHVIPKMRLQVDDHSIVPIYLMAQCVLARQINEIGCGTRVARATPENGNARLSMS
jgi:hypothetical protein